MVLAIAIVIIMTLMVTAVIMGRIVGILCLLCGASGWGSGSFRAEGSASRSFPMKVCGLWSRILGLFLEVWSVAPSPQSLALP